MNKISAFAQSDNGLIAAGIAAAFILLTSAVSFHSASSGSSQALTSPSATDNAGAPSGAGSTPAPSAAAGTASVGASGVAAGGNAPTNVIPPALRGVDFGLKTQGVTSKEVKV